MPSIVMLVDFPKVADFRFTMAAGYNTPYSEISGFYQFDQRPLPSSTMDWQMPKTYHQKKAFTDKCTIIVNTRAIGPEPIYPDLVLVGPSASYSISATTFGNGAQRISGNTLTDYNTGISYPADTFQWQFYPNEVTSEAGCYYLEMIVYGNAEKTVSRTFYSDPILINDVFPNCVLIESKYTVNRQSEGVVVSGWNDGLAPTFQHRVEGFPLQYKPKANYISYLQQDYLNKQLNVNSWRTFVFKLGEISSGVPAYLVEKVSKAFETDFFKIDGKPFVLDVDNSTGLQSLWENTDPEASNLMWSVANIRERYSNQSTYISETPSDTIELFEADAYPFAVSPFRMIIGDTVINPIPHVIDDNAEYNDYIDYLNGLTSLGTFYRVGQTTYFDPNEGVTAVIAGAIDILYDYFNLTYTGLGVSDNGYAFAGVGSKQVVDWGDGTDASWYYSVVGSTVSATHEFDVSSSPTLARVFHNNAIGTLLFDESGDTYPITGSVKLAGVTGDTPSGLTVFRVIYCNKFADATWANTLMIDLNKMPNLGYLQIAYCPLLQFVSPALASVTTPLANIFWFGTFYCPFDSTEVDAIYNEFVANVWGGVVDGDMDTKVAPEYTAAPPTAASAASRLALTSDGWTLVFD
jgi:hypothetical protein